MKDEAMYKVGDTVRIYEKGYDGTKFIFGVVTDIKYEDISYHGSSHIVPFYSVDIGNRTMVVNDKYDYSPYRGNHETYICAVPTAEQVVDKINHEIEDLKAQIEKLNAEIETKKGIKFDAISGTLDFNNYKL